MAFPLYQIAYRDQGGVDFYTSHLALLCESVQILSGSGGLLELRELETAGPEEVGF